jgi:hypothetical protein
MPARRVFSLFAKSSGPDSRRQKQPDFRQHFLNRLPDPHGQRSFRPNFSVSSLLPWTIRTPRFTFVSEGKPLRRFLIVSKKMAVGRGLAGPIVNRLTGKKATIQGIDIRSGRKVRGRLDEAQNASYKMRYAQCIPTRSVCYSLRC